MAYCLQLQNPLRLTIYPTKMLLVLTRQKFLIKRPGYFLHQLLILRHIFFIKALTKTDLLSILLVYDIQFCRSISHLYDMTGIF